MNHYKPLTCAVLASAICFISVFGLLGNAQAWTWKGFSDLCVSDQFRGPEGVIVFTLREATVFTQCYNVNTYNLNQPGAGNGGDAGLTNAFDTTPTKTKGVVSFEGCIDLGIFDNHDDPDHFHTCIPYDNTNKEEVPGTAWVADFVADWVLYDDDPALNPNAKEKNRGTDTCFWEGGFTDEIRTLAGPDGENGTEDDVIVTVQVPEHEIPFTCSSTSDKKINFYTE